jgi:hypothetical protein
LRVEERGKSVRLDEPVPALMVPVTPVKSSVCMVNEEAAAAVKEFGAGIFNVCVLTVKGVVGIYTADPVIAVVELFVALVVYMLLYKLIVGAVNESMSVQKGYALAPICPLIVMVEAADIFKS